MRALRKLLEQLSLENKQFLIILVCFFGDLINAFLVYQEVSDFRNLRRILWQYSEDAVNYADILNAPEFQLQIYQMLIRVTITTSGLLIFFHAVVYYFFFTKKKYTEFYLKFLTFCGGLFSLWYGLKSLAINPLYSGVILLAFAYFVAFYTLRLISEKNPAKNSDWGEISKT